MLQKVLVVDDDEAVRNSICDLIAGLGISEQVVGARNGKEALAELRGAGLVITDLKMPVMGGLELLERIRTRPDWKTPVVVTSGNPPQEWMGEALQAGASLTLQKPFKLKELKKWLLQMT